MNSLFSGEGRILTAHQPMYLPWAGLFHKMMMADAFIFYDDVQLEYHEFVNRNRVLSVGQTVLLTVPVMRKGHLTSTIKDTRIADLRFARKHLRTLELAYGKHPYFDRYMPSLTEILGRGHQYLADLNIDLMRWLMRELDINVPTARSSDLGLEGTKSSRVLDMCRKVGARTYVFGAAGLEYADRDAFAAAGIELKFQSYTPPVYTQPTRQPFVSGLSVIDLLFCHGPDARAIIEGGSHASR